MRGHGKRNSLVSDPLGGVEISLAEKSKARDGKLRVLLTGASGFIGQHLVKALISEPDVEVITLGRSSVSGLTNFDCVLSSDSDFSASLLGVHTVIHLGGMSSVGPGEEENAFDVNTAATLKLAEQAALAGVRRFIFISSAKVLGDSSSLDGFFEYGSADPQGIYALTKAKAEAGLNQLSEAVEMDVVIIRPPIVYGPGVKGNFRQLIRIAAKELPLPFRLARSPRSMVFVANLVDQIRHCLLAECTLSGIFHCKDAEDLSLSDLIARIRLALGHSAFLLPVPVFLMSLPLASIGKRKIADQLFSPFVLSDERSRAILNWTPPYTVEQGLKITIDSLKNETDSAADF